MLRTNNHSQLKNEECIHSTLIKAFQKVSIALIGQYIAKGKYVI